MSAVRAVLKQCRTAFDHRKICAGLVQDLIGLAQFPVLAFRRLPLPGHLAGDTGPLAAVRLGLVDPIVQGLGRAADLR